MKEPKLTPDQLHRLIDEIAPLADVDDACMSLLLADACSMGECADWWTNVGRGVYWEAVGKRLCDQPLGVPTLVGTYAGLSAVLILLSEGG